MTPIAAVNNLMKGIYAVAFGARSVGIPSALVLAGLGIASLLLFAAT